MNKSYLNIGHRTLVIKTVTTNPAGANGRKSVLTGIAIAAASVAGALGSSSAFALVCTRQGVVEVCVPADNIGVAIVANPDSINPGEHLILSGGGKDQPIKEFFRGDSDGAGTVITIGDPSTLANNAISTQGAMNMNGRQINNMAAGVAGQDAVNLNQLRSLSTSTSTGISSLSTGLSTTSSNLATVGNGAAKALGGGSAYDAATGKWTAPSYAVNNANGSSAQVNNVGDAMTGLHDQGTKYFHANSALNGAIASGKDAVAVGPNARATGTNAIAIGSGALATGSQAIGANARAGGGGVALGDGADAGGTILSAAPSVAKGTAIGFGAVVQQSGGVALGAGSVAITGAGVGGHLLGNTPAKQAAAVKATTGTQAAVSVGDAANGQLRQITGVAAGSADSDASNVAQMKAAAAAVQAGSVQYATNPDGSVNYGQVNMGNGQAPGGTRISNVAPGVQGGDAVNVKQLQQAVYSGRSFAAKGVAAAMAIPSIPQLEVGKKWVGAALGNYAGQSALGVAVGYQIDQNFNVGLGVSSATGKGSRTGTRVQLGYGW
jgi:autotransporter adhesin